MRRAGNRLRITVQLIGVADGRTLWSERYDREMADVFAIQDEIAGTIVSTLRATLLARPRRRSRRSATPRTCGPISSISRGATGGTGGPRPPSSKGSSTSSRRSPRIRDTPSPTPDCRTPTRSRWTTAARRCAKGWSGPGRSPGRRSRWTTRWRRRTRRSAGCRFIYDWDWAAARPGVRPRRAAQPGLLGGPPVARLVPHGDGPGRGRAGRRADGRSSSIRRRCRSAAAWDGCIYYARQPTELALDHLRRALAMNPTADENHRLLGLAYLRLGQYDDAAAAFREAVGGVGHARRSPPPISGVVAAARGRTSEARAVLDGLRGRGSGAVRLARRLRRAARAASATTTRRSRTWSAPMPTAEGGWPISEMEPALDPVRAIRASPGSAGADAAGLTRGADCPAGRRRATSRSAAGRRC